MAIRKPNGGAKAASTAPLTSVQDTRSRGNGNGNGERVLMSFKIPSDLKMMLQENARERGTTASRIIIDGIRHELGLDDRRNINGTDINGHGRTWMVADVRSEKTREWYGSGKNTPAARAGNGQIASVGQSESG